MNTYKSTDSSKITDHFRVSEFRCKCGGNHDTQLDIELVNKLEKLHRALNCSKIIVNSGYRCPTHDRNVGGNGAGKHTTGQAADIVCYDKDGRIISSKIICCAAQESGFGGIANIDNTYTATHVDTRTSNKWYGNEAVAGGTASSVCSDFYKHFGLSHKDVYGVRTLDISVTVDGVTYSGTLKEK